MRILSNLVGKFIVADMEVDMVAEMDVDKVANMMVKIPNEDFTDVTLAIGDIYGDDV